MKEVSIVSQAEEYRCKKQLHSAVHWLLLHRERQFDGLDDYFSSLILRIKGFSSLMGNPQEYIELLALIEGARIESNSENYSHQRYRKAILDAHSVIDRLPWRIT